MSIKQKLIDHMADGYALCDGIAVNITGAQSAGRRRREIIEESPSKYCFFWAEPKNGGAPYKVFIRNVSLTKRIVESDNGYRIRGYVNNSQHIDSKEYSDKKLAKRGIKMCKES